jgi:hypothetical protein
MIAAALSDELPFWRTDDAAKPDYEIPTAIKPRLSRSDALVWIVAICAARFTIRAYRKNFGKNNDSVLV